MLLAGAYHIHFMVAHQAEPGPERTYIPKGNFGGPEVRLIPMNRETTLVDKTIY
jgi:hypothetical protein